MNSQLKSLFVVGGIALATTHLAAGCTDGNEPPRTALAVTPRLATQGERIYFGDVFPLQAPAKKPTFVYERRVAARGDALSSTHVTRNLAGQVVLAEEAIHSKDYGLAFYELHTNQAGQRGTIRVDHGDVHFRLVDGTDERTAVERRSDAPIVVGPTLIGYIVRHLPELRAGETLRVRLALLDRLETLGFELQAVPATLQQTRVRMVPASFLVGLAVDPVLFTFERSTDKLVRLEGRVPSKESTSDGLRDFDARVEYRFVAARYL